MARIREWFDLGKNTIVSLRSDDVTSLYSLEWPEAREVLIADHKATIDGERRRLRRWFRTGNAILFGLAKRLSPIRRLLFLLALFFFAGTTFTLMSKVEGVQARTVAELVVAFLMMVFLLALELIDKIKMRDELVLARELQASLIPKDPVQTEEYEVASFNHIANTVGGDIYDFVPVKDGRLAVLFGDASGHGMTAGLVMAVAHAAFRTQLDIDPSPAAINESLNRILCRTGGPRSFFSCCYVLLSPDGTFVATFAGHPQMLKIDVNGRVSERLGCGAYPLGVKSGMCWEEIHGRLDRGERLLLHSDGLTEARDVNDREFGDAYVESIVAWRPQGTASHLVQDLVTAWQQFTAGRPSEDDTSIAVIGRK